jgi:hypothetical protein
MAASLVPRINRARGPAFRQAKGRAIVAPRARSCLPFSTAGHDRRAQSRRTGDVHAFRAQDFVHISAFPPLTRV